MIRKLRVKFVATAMLAVFIVLASMLGLINFLNYRNIINSTDEILELLAVNEGTFPKEFDSDNIGNGFLGFSSPEIPYESRYFSVQLDPDGVLLLVDIDQIAAIDEDTAVSYAQEAMGSSNDRGFISTYRYLKRSSQDGTSIIFLDCGRNLSTLRAFFLLSILGGLGGFLLTFLVVLLLSGLILKPVAESYSRQKRFITDAGHEIKTPLTIIGADTTLLEMEWGENEWLTDIQKQITRLTELTNELIYLSKMEEDRQIPMIVFPLSDLVQETLTSFQSLAATQGKLFQAQIQPLLSLRGDEKSIRQLITILLDNAVKYSPKGGTVSVSLNRQGKNLKLAVRNTAETISKENLPHLFERFYRGDPSRNSGNSGYGIGLSIAKAITEAHRGRIAASMQDERSLQITVSLPAAASQTKGGIL